jgi:CheY-like chemotaxis protein
LVAERQPDLIILGLRTGAERRDWQLLTRFALDPATSDIPLIICSGDLRLLEEKQAVLTRLGIGVLPKPFDPDELFYSVQAGLESRAAWWERA